MSPESGGSELFLVPEGFDDDSRVSGGNRYDLRLVTALRARSVEIGLLPVPVDRPEATAAALARIPDAKPVLVDGLVAIGAPDELRAHATRLRIVVLAHMVAAAIDATTASHERAALRAAHRVIATSEWTRHELVARGLADPARIAVARPGADPVPTAAGSTSGDRILCIGTVAEHKGQDLLVEALAGLAEVPGWTCSIVGSTGTAPDYVDRLRATIGAAGLDGRIALTGVLTGPRIEAAYATADLLVAPSRTESYGMAVAEALARGIPVLASRVGGIPEAVDGRPGGVLVAPEAEALRAALRRWCEDPGHRAERKAAAMRSRGIRRAWDATAGIVAAVLESSRAGAAPRREPAAADARSNREDWTCPIGRM